MAPRLLYLVTEDWYFLSHRLVMARAARDAGFEVHVATRVRDGRAAIEAEGFTLHPLGWRRGSVSPLGNLRAVLEIRALLGRVRPALLHDVSMKPAILGGLAALGGRAPAVVSSLTGLGSGFLARGLKGRVARAVLSAVLRFLLDRPRSRTIVQNPDDDEALRAVGIAAERIVRIPGSGVDTARFTPRPEPAGPITAAYVGRMLEDKGLVALREAMRLLRGRGVEIRLLLAGRCDPENPSSLTEDQMRAWDAEPGVTWLGPVDDVAALWSRAHIAVLPSRREGLPMSLLEAAASGRPMVASDATGCREIAIEGRTALTHPVDDAAALADALGTLAGDADLRARLGAEARRLVEERFSAAIVGEATVALYRELTRASSP